MSSTKEAAQDARAFLLSRMAKILTDKMSHEERWVLYAEVAAYAEERIKLPRQQLPSDDEIRQLWRAAGGDFHGPHVEHAFMEETKFLIYMRKLLAPTSDVLLAIQEKLDGVEWTPDTLEEIAQLLIDNGYRVRDRDDCDQGEIHGIST